MAVANPKPTAVDMLRQQAGDSRRSQALDAELLKVVSELQEPDFDEVAARVGENTALRDGLAAWLVSARTRGLLEQMAVGDNRQRFAVTQSGRDQLHPGG